jgi:hypothetical protein
VAIVVRKPVQNHDRMRTPPGHQVVAIAIPFGREGPAQKAGRLGRGRPRVGLGGITDILRTPRCPKTIHERSSLRSSLPDLEIAARSRQQSLRQVRPPRSDPRLNPSTERRPFSTFEFIDDIKRRRDCRDPRFTNPWVDGNRATNQLGPLGWGRQNTWRGRSRARYEGESSRRSRTG